MTSRPQLFKAIQHEVRLEIIYRLNIEHPVIYSDLLDLTEGSTGKLNYHLRILGDLVSKTDGGYVLSEHGRKVISWLNRLFEEEDFDNEKPAVVIEPFYPMRELKAKYILFTTILFLPFVGLVFISPLLLLPIVLLYLFAAVFLVKYCNRITYQMDEAEIIVHKGIITLTEKIVPYRTITNIELVQGPFDRLFGMSTVKVYTAGTNMKGGAEETLVGLPDGEDVKNAIFERIALLNPPKFSEDHAFARILSSIKELNEELR